MFDVDTMNIFNVTANFLHGRFFVNKLRLSSHSASVINKCPDQVDDISLCFHLVYAKLVLVSYLITYIQFLVVAR